MSSTVCVISPDNSGVFRYGGGTSWTQIRDRTTEMDSGDWGLIARDFTGSPWQYYDGTPNQWENMGGPGGLCFVGTDTVYASAPDGLYQFDGYDDGGRPSWSKISGPPGTPDDGVMVCAGKWGVVSRRGHFIQGDLYRYTGTPNEWERIAPGGDGSNVLVVGKDTVYRRAQDWAIYQYDGFGTSWTRITEPLVTHAIVMRFGLWGLVYTDFDQNSMYRYLGTPGQWQRIGDHRPWFAVTDDTVYAIPLDKNGVYRYDGGTSWTKIGGPSFASGGIAAMD